MANVANFAYSLLLIKLWMLLWLNLEVLLLELQISFLQDAENFQTVSQDCKPLALWPKSVCIGVLVAYPNEIGDLYLTFIVLPSLGRLKTSSRRSHG